MPGPAIHSTFPQWSMAGASTFLLLKGGETHEAVLQSADTRDLTSKTPSVFIGELWPDVYLGQTLTPMDSLDEERAGRILH